MIMAGHTLGTPGHSLAEALRLFRTAALDAAYVIYQDDYPAAISPSDPRSAQQAAAIADADGVPLVALPAYTTSITSGDAASWQQGLAEFRACLQAAHTAGATPMRAYHGAWPAGRPEPARHRGQRRGAPPALPSFPTRRPPVLRRPADHLYFDGSGAHDRRLPL